MYSERECFTLIQSTKQVKNSVCWETSYSSKKSITAMEKRGAQVAEGSKFRTFGETWHFRVMRHRYRKSSSESSRRCAASTTRPRICNIRVNLFSYNTLPRGFRQCSSASRLVQCHINQLVERWPYKGYRMVQSIMQVELWKPPHRSPSELG